LIKYATEIQNIIKMKFKEVLVYYMSTCGDINHAAFILYLLMVQWYD